MDTIRVIFTYRRYNPISWLIRWALPRSRFAMALASHCLIVDGDSVIEANMLHGVRRVSRDVGLSGLTVVRIVDYHVPDRGCGIEWARAQVGKRYDWRGALGLAIDTDRAWQDESDWFCFELVAATLAKAGRDVFFDTGHITGSALMLIRP